MKIITNNSVVFNYGNEIELGKWENDPSTETYKISKDNHNEYCVKADFVVYEVPSIPEDYEPNKYYYSLSEGFTLNPNHKPHVSDDYKAGYDQAVLDLMEA